MRKLSVEKVEAMLRKHSGNKGAVAKACGVSRTAVQLYIKDRPRLQAITEECKESLIDVAENSLEKAMRAGEAWAVCFFLKTQGKSRGYIERTEQSQVGELRMVLTEEIVDGGTQGIPTDDQTPPSTI